MSFCEFDRNVVARLFLVASLFISILVIAVSPASAQATYSYTGNTFDTVLGGYTTSMNITGEFTLSSQLAPNMLVGTDISSQVLSYSFFDGVQTLTQANSYIVQFIVGTDSFCQISRWNITIWQGDSLVSGVDIGYNLGPPDNSTDFGFQGVPCSTTAGGQCVDPSLVIDNGTDYGKLFSIPATPGIWSGPTCPETPPAQYSYVGNTFDTVLGAYSTSMWVSGEFSIPVALGPNLPPGTDISSQVLSYSFFDGVQTLTEADSYIVVFRVGTNSFCEISQWSITIWQGDSLVSGVDIGYNLGPPDNSTDFGFQGVPCSTTAGGQCVDPILVIDNGTDYGKLFSLPATPGIWDGPTCPETPPAQYLYSGNTFDTVLGAYTTSMRISGGFTVPVELGPNLAPGTDISSQVLSYSFFDGVQTLTQANSYIVQFNVGTDSFCQISRWNITIWQGDSLVSGVDVGYNLGPPDNSTDFGFQGVPCSTTAGGQCVDPQLVIDDGTDYGQLFSIPATPGIWRGPGCQQQPQGQAIPTLDWWGLSMLVALMAGIAVWIIFRRQRV